MPESGPGGLGQRKHFDPQNTRFLIADLMKTDPVIETKKLAVLATRSLDPEKAQAAATAAQVNFEYWYDSAYWGDQGDSSDCTAFCATHIEADGPVTHKARPVTDPFVFFQRIQAIDRREGRYYDDGATTLAMCKAMQEAGKIENYYWGYTVSDFLLAIRRGPVALGIDWLTGMDQPERSTGIIRATGTIRGGHEIDANGMNFKTGLLRLKQSWGRKWAKNGHCYLPIEDLELLLGRGGDMTWFKEKRDAA